MNSFYDKVCVVIGSYPKNSIDSALLSLTLHNIKRHGYKTCLVTHAPVNTDIQKEINYFIYSDENEVLEFPQQTSSYVFYNYDNFYIQSNLSNKIGTHSYSVLVNMKNAFSLLREKGFTHFIYMETDSFLNDDDFNKLNDLLKKADIINQDYWFMNENYDSNNTLLVTSLFAGKIEYFRSLFAGIKNITDYIIHCNGAYILEFLITDLVSNSFGNGVIEQIKPRELFTSEWLGISNSGSVMIPGLKYDNFFIDLVRDELNVNKIVAVILNIVTENKVRIRLYYNNNLLCYSDELTPNLNYYWFLDSGLDDTWKYEVLINEKVVKTMIRKGSDILNNNISYFKLK